jgi:hypothetical protein
LDWLSKKSNGTSEFWEASMSQKFGAQRFGFSLLNTGASSGIGCEEGETPFLVFRTSIGAQQIGSLI